MGVDFAREVHILSHARHAMNDDHVWRVPLLYAFGCIGDDTPLLAGSTYLIMSRLGSSLSTIVDRVYGGVVPVPIVMNIALQVSVLHTGSLERAVCRCCPRYNLCTHSAMRTTTSRRTTLRWRWSRRINCASMISAAQHSSSTRLPVCVVLVHSPTSICAYRRVGGTGDVAY